MYVYLQVASRVPGGDEVRLLIFFHHPPTPHIYTLSLHDALPISFPRLRAHRNGSGERQPSGKVQNSSSANRKSLSGVSRRLPASEPRERAVSAKARVCTDERLPLPQGR